MRFLLIPVHYAVSALQAYFDTHPDHDGLPPTRDELQAVARLATRVIATSEVLVRYAVALAGRPGRN